VAGSVEIRLGSEAKSRAVQGDLARQIFIVPDEG
jgi:hypothetical protein